MELETVCEDDVGETNSLNQEGSIPKVLKQMKKQVEEENKTKIENDLENGRGNINKLDEKPKFSINTSWTVLTQSEDKVNHVNLVRLDPGGTVSAVMEMEKMYKKSVSAETKHLLILILSYPQQGVNMISSSQCYSQTMEEYEHTAAMLVKVARVENTDHADLMRLKQDVIVLGTRLR